MTRKENLHVVKTTTSVDEGIIDTYFTIFMLSFSFFTVNFVLNSSIAALEALVEKRVTGFPVIDDDWNLVVLLFLHL